jgi:hypothetical protein
VTDYLLKNVVLAPEDSRFTGTVAAVEQVSLLASVEDLSEEEVDRMLAARDQESTP